MDWLKSSYHTTCFWQAVVTVTPVGPESEIESENESESESEGEGGKWKTGKSNGIPPNTRAFPPLSLPILILVLVLVLVLVLDLESRLLFWMN